MLTGNYVYLRSIEESDLEQLLEWRNQPNFRCFFREYRELNMSQQREWYKAVNERGSNALMFAIVDKENNELLGATGLCYLDLKNRSADVSIYIGRDNLYIDEKYAPDTIKTLMQYGFDEVNLYRLWTEIYTDDKAKIKLYESLGYHLDGTHRATHWSNGKFGDSHFFSFLKSDLK